MLNKSIDGTKCAMFDKNRFIAVAGRLALHVFDLEKMEFVLADVEQGYSTLSQ